MIHKTLLTVAFVAALAGGMVHSETPFHVLVIRESELGRYDTTKTTACTVFDFDGKYVVDGKNYQKPKYNIIIKMGEKCQLQQ